MARAIPIITLLLILTNIFRAEDDVKITVEIEIGESNFNEMNNIRQSCIVIADEVVKIFKGEQLSTAIITLKNDSDAGARIEAYQKFKDEVDNYFKTVEGMKHPLMSNIEIIKVWFCHKVESVLSPDTRDNEVTTTHIKFNHIGMDQNNREKYIQDIIAEVEKNIIQYVHFSLIEIKFTRFDITAQQIGETTRLDGDSYKFDKIAPDNKQLQIRYSSSLTEDDCRSNLQYSLTKTASFSVKGSTLQLNDDFEDLPKTGWETIQSGTLEFTFQLQISKSDYSWPSIQKYKQELDNDNTFKINAILTVNGKLRHLKVHIYKSNNILRTLI